MPLAFDTKDRGRIAFGFFQIESDMLLFENHFFFADSFCAAVAEVTQAGTDQPFDRAFQIWTIPRREDVGDLHGAIQGVRHTGFIGETYRRHPFPADPEGFRQNPSGSATQDEMRGLITPFAREEDIRFSGRPPDEVRFGSATFSREGFQALVLYVWRGGYPRWRDGVRPGYVEDLADTLSVSGHWLARGLAFESSGPVTP